ESRRRFATITRGAAHSPPGAQAPRPDSRAASNASPLAAELPGLEAGLESHAERARDAVREVVVGRDLRGLHDRGVVAAVLAQPLDVLELALAGLACEGDRAVEQHAVAGGEIRLAIVVRHGVRQLRIAERRRQLGTVMRYAIAAAVGGRDHDRDHLRL